MKEANLTGVSSSLLTGKLFTATDSAKQTSPPTGSFPQRRRHVSPPSPKRFRRFADLRYSLTKTAVRHSKAVRPRDRCRPYLVLIPYDLCCTLSDDHTGSHGITGGHAWHDRSIRDAKVFDAVNFEEDIHHTHGVPPHFGRGCLMPKAKCCVADVVF